MPKNYIRILVICILLFHLLITIHGFWTMFSDFDSWTLYHVRPFLQLLVTLAWLGIVLQKRWSFFVYITLLFYELAMKLFFGQYIFGQVFGDVFFPANLLFAFIIMIVYKSHFSNNKVE